MAEQKKMIRRRNQPPREHIAEGEFRNVTFRAGATAYNLLADASNRERCSISEFSERLVEDTISGNSENIYNLDPELHRRIKAVATQNNRSVTAEIEDRLRSSLSPHLDVLTSAGNIYKKSGQVLHALAAVLSKVSFDQGWPNKEARLGLTTVFNEILNKHYPDVPPLFPELSGAVDPEKMKKVEERLVVLTRSVLEQQHEDLWGERGFLTRLFGQLKGGLLGAIAGATMDPAAAEMSGGEVPAEEEKKIRVKRQKS
ncbi:hypothetical protein [Methylobacterium sp. GC_Met_2]|uniref:hypothetical protein n=1 Tax=Methylobacterium sp. GC_Met_2 TaxID=2937376 RepID=UPI00226B46DF|nr:hypothetical protein [Methylobacterium sp. GC_Met_2]